MGLLAVYIAGDTLRHQPIGAGHMTSTFLVHPIQFWVTHAINQSRHAQEGLDGVSSTHPYMVRFNCGFRPMHFPPLLSRSPTSVGDLQNILFYWPESLIQYYGFICKTFLHIYITKQFSMYMQ